MKYFYCLLAFILVQDAFGQTPVIKMLSKGLRVDTAYFAVGLHKVSDNSFPEGTKLYIKLSGVKGFAVKDGKAFPGCSMKVSDVKGKSILDYKDLFTDEAGINHEDAKFLSLALTIGSPMEVNQMYHWDIKVWDKVTKSEVSVATIVHVLAVKDVLGITKKSEGLTCESTIVMSDVPLTTNQCHDGEKLTFVFSGLKGFSLNKTGEVNLGASLIVKDPKGNKVVEISDLFKEEKSYAPTLTESIRMYLTIGDPMLSGNRYNWILKIWDKNSTKAIEASVHLDVVEK